jgi:uncharacterized membrane protein
MQDDYFNINYDYYWLNIAKLAQALFLIVILLVIIIVANLVVFLLYAASDKQSPRGKKLGEILSQFKFNVYIRYYMLAFFDITFFSVMKIVEGNDSTSARKMATLASKIIICFSFVVPVVLNFIVCKRFEVMKIKAAKASFNTIVLKIDKQSRWRLIVPSYFFLRRLLTAGLLSMPIDNTFIFLQYVFILMSSHAYVLYLVAIKPYQSPLLNNYVLSNETFYSAVIISIFIFSDATPELNIKFWAGVVLISSIFLLIFANFLMIVILSLKGKDKMKEEIKKSKLQRAEKEIMEEEEEQERQQRLKKEEEEFTRLPEEATNMAHYDVADETGATLDTKDGLLASKKKKSKKKQKDTDQVNEYSMNGTEAFNAQTEEGLKKKKKKRRDKNRAKDDAVEEAAVASTNDATEGKTDKAGKKTKGSSDDPSGGSSSENKDKKGKKGKEKRGKEVDPPEEDNLF